MVHPQKIFLLFVFTGFLVTQVPIFVKANQDELQSQQLITNLGEEILDAIMQFDQKQLTYQQLQQLFMTAIYRDFDLQWIARFVLGRFYRKATQEEKQQYLRLFPKFIQKTYLDQFQTYSEEKFRIGEVQTKRSYIFVASEILLNTEQKSDSIPVIWRLRQNKQGEWKIVDVEVTGVSIGRTIRKEFSSFIQRNRGNISMFLKTLEEKVQG